MNGLIEALANGGTLVVAEGYMWEIERRGYLQLGNYLPEVVLDHPEVIKQLHEEFAHAGSDVIEAFTYYAHREMLKLRGREEDLEKLNRTALKMAREVADRHGKLMAGNVSNTPLYEPDDPKTHEVIYAMFKEQVQWAVEEGADFIIGETFGCYGEAEIALRAIKDWGKGLPAVITIAAYVPERTTDDVPLPEACRRLQDAGAAVVGLNCSRGPETLMPLIREVKKLCTVPIAALPVAYRTNAEEKTFFALRDPKSGKRVYPDNLDCVRCSREDARKFAEEARAAGVQYIGLCCGNAPNLTRELAEVYRKEPPASRFRSRMELSMVFGDKAKEYGAEMSTTAKWMTGDGL